MTPIADQIERIEKHGEFDKAWYVSSYPGVANSGLAPVEHYVRLGAREGKNPNPDFDTLTYVADHPEVGEAGVNPFLHYLEQGRRAQDSA